MRARPANESHKLHLKASRWCDAKHRGVGVAGLLSLGARRNPLSASAKHNDEHRNESPQNPLALGLAIIVLFTSGCATPVGVSRLDEQAAHRELNANVLTANRASAYATQILERAALSHPLGDPAISSRYQIWGFVYNSGNPIALSAMRLRESLQAFRKDIDPEDKDPALIRCRHWPQPRGARDQDDCRR